MSDLVIGVVIVLTVSAAAWIAGSALARRLPRAGGELFALASLVLLLAYTILLWDRPELTRLLPFSNTIVLGNWFPPLAVFLAAIAWRLVPGSVLRRTASTAALTGMAFYSLIRPLTGGPPVCDDRWTSDGFCMQTTGATCSAAAAATLLKLHGIDTTEREMAKLCLTRKGTHWLGLYRGLKLKTSGTPWKVEVVACDARDVVASGDVPMIAAVGPSFEDAKLRSELGPDNGWHAGVQHSVLLIGSAPRGVVEVFDPHPAYQRERWDREIFERLWRGHGIRLVRHTDVDGRSGAGRIAIGSGAGRYHSPQRR